MADLSLLSTGLSPVWPEEAEIKSFIAAADLTAGNPVYLNTSGKVDKTAAGGVSPINRFRGIALETVKSGQVVDIMTWGYLQGYDLSALAYDAPVYASNTAGALADAAGTTSLVVGRVTCLSDSDKTKILRVTGWAG